MSVFVVVPNGAAAPTFFESALEALTEAQATGGDAYWRMFVKGGQGVRIELAAADAALHEIVVAASPNAESTRPEDCETSSVSVLGDDECRMCGSENCVRECENVANRLLREKSREDFLTRTRPVCSASDAEANSEAGGAAAIRASE